MLCCVDVGMMRDEGGAQIQQHQSGIAVSVVTANVDRQISVTTTHSNINNTQPKQSYDYMTHPAGTQPGKCAAVLLFTTM